MNEVTYLNSFNTEHYFSNFLKCMDDNERYSWIKDTLKSLDIEYEIQSFETFNNIICKGKSDIWAVAHYDTIDIRYCANDNSASIINLIHLKLMNPELNVVFLDVEEPPYFGLGSTMLSSYIHDKNLDCRYILNLELTGYGIQICTGSHMNTISFLIQDKLNGIAIDTPFSDTDIFIQNLIPSVLIFTLNKVNEKVIKESIYHCHTNKDTYDKINTNHMDHLVGKLTDFLKEEMSETNRTL